MNPLVSVIVPVYNVDKYIEKSISSIINQSYRNIEILLIDDGSTDNSPALCDKLASLDSRITVIHKINGGVSSARNTGITLSNGYWLMFVDADDWIEIDAIEKMVSSVSNKNYDMVLGSYIWEINGKEVRASEYSERIIEFDVNKDRDLFVSACMLRPSDALYIFNDSYHCLPKLAVPVSKLYRASIIKDNGLLFDEQLALGEDLLFNCNCFKYINSLLFVNEPLYHYVIRKGSAVNSNLDRKYIMICDFLTALEKNIRFQSDVVINSFNFSSLILIEEYIQNSGMVVCKIGGFSKAKDRIDSLLKFEIVSNIRNKINISNSFSRRERMMLSLIKKGKSAAALRICVIYYKLFPGKNRY